MAGLVGCSMGVRCHSEWSPSCQDRSRFNYWSELKRFPCSANDHRLHLDCDFVGHRARGRDFHRARDLDFQGPAAIRVRLRPVVAGGREHVQGPARVRDHRKNESPPLWLASWCPGLVEGGVSLIFLRPVNRWAPGRPS